MVHYEASKQDEAVVILGRRNYTKSTAKSKADIENAHRAGKTVEVSKKIGSGGQTKGGLGAQARKIEETEVGAIKRVSKEQAKAIVQGRQAKKMTQKELAQKCNVLPTVISQYETAKAQPDQRILAKMQRILGVKIQGL